MGTNALRKRNLSAFAALHCPATSENGPALLKVATLNGDGARGPMTNDPRDGFEANPTLDELMAQQGKGPITDVLVLHGDFWPRDEPIEDFLAALREWRGHGKSSKSDPAA
jgi:hypothetical protein